MGGRQVACNQLRDSESRGRARLFYLPLPFEKTLLFPPRQIGIPVLLVKFLCQRETCSGQGQHSPLPLTKSFSPDFLLALYFGRFLVFLSIIIHILPCFLCQRG